MWVLFAFGSAFFAGITAILAKVGIRNTDSDTATAIRTVVVLLFSWLMAWISGSIGQLSSVSAKTWLFLVLSGLATGASWLCYFRAIQVGDLAKVAVVDKTSVALVLLLAMLFLGERPSGRDWAGIVLILSGVGLLVLKR